MKETKAKNTKNRRILIVFLIAAAAAMAAVLSVYAILTPQRVTVFIFNNNYPAGTQVRQEMLTAVQINSTVIQSGKRVSTSDWVVTGNEYNTILQNADTLRTDVYAGNIFTSSMLTTAGGGSVEMRMRKDAIAVTVSVNDISGATRELKFGSRVNVYAGYSNEVRLILENMKILGVNSGNNGMTSVTIETDINASLILIHAEMFGTVHLGVVDASGYMYSNVDMPAYNASGFITD